MTSTHIKQISKEIWRLLEVYLFFVVSVMGGVCIGKISQTGKAKLKSSTEIHQVDLSLYQKKQLDVNTGAIKPFKQNALDAKSLSSTSYKCQYHASVFWRSILKPIENYSENQNFIKFPEQVLNDFHQKNYPLLI